MLKDLIVKNRSHRRFHQGKAVARKTLEQLVDLARLSPSGGNQQSLKYILSCDPQRNALVFPCLLWAGYLKDWRGPAPGERPAAYVIILADKTLAKSPGCDHGIAAQSILLGAVELGLRGCIIGSVKRDDLRKALHIPSRHEILLVIALGKPRETVVLENVGPTGSIKYWRDDAGVHHVPKRALKDIVIG